MRRLRDVWFLVNGLNTTLQLSEGMRTTGLPCARLSPFTVTEGYEDNPDTLLLGPNKHYEKWRRECWHWSWQRLVLNEQRVN